MPVSQARSPHSPLMSRGSSSPPEGRSAGQLVSWASGRDPPGSAGQQLVGVGAEEVGSQLGERGALDLADPLSRQVQDGADLLEGARFAPVEAVAEPEYLPLVRAERAEQPLDLL